MGNRFHIQLAILALIIAVICVTAWILASLETCAWCAALGVIVLVFFVVVSRMRQAEIRRITNEIDEVINSGRILTFDNYHEGDVAVLANTLHKTTDKLARLGRLLAEEKSSLADALADISHQIRTPLTAAELTLAAIERTSSETERKHQIRRLERLLERISWLVTALLKMAKADAGALPFDPQPLDASKLIARAIEPLSLSLELRDLNMKLDIDSDARLTVDERWSVEAIENIVKNAIESTPAGGTITIAAREDALACRIIIEDSGQGIADEDLPHLFERFYRGQSVTDSKLHDDAPTGFGIGLSLAQSLVVAQGGTLRAENITPAFNELTSAEAHHVSGARFIIVFPKMIV